MEEPTLAQVNQGRCRVCGKMLTRRGIRRHAADCVVKNEPPLAPGAAKKKEYRYLIDVTPQYGKDYWLILDVAATSDLDVLDGALRHLWCECCAHLSGFYNKRRDDLDGTLQRLFQPGDEFFYDYDYGSTTSLALSVISVRQAIVIPLDVRLIARNEPPVFPCGECGKPAVVLCTDCSGYPLCPTHAPKHGCGEEMQLPLVNSPRTGVCGYYGDAEHAAPAELSYLYPPPDKSKSAPAR